jgi:hypothetical protein
VTQPAQLTLADAYEDDEITSDEWFRSLPLDLGSTQVAKTPAALTPPESLSLPDQEAA